MVYERLQTRIESFSINLSTIRHQHRCMFFVDNNGLYIYMYSLIDKEKCRRCVYHELQIVFQMWLEFSHKWFSKNGKMNEKHSSQKKEMKSILPYPFSFSHLHTQHLQNEKTKMIQSVFFSFSVYSCFFYFATFYNSSQVSYLF